MAKKTEEIYSFLLLLISKTGQEIFNTWVCQKVLDDVGEPTNEDEITVATLFKKFD